MDGVNRYRGENELNQYTPEYGSTTRTNIWGYEITVVNDTVVKMGATVLQFPITVMYSAITPAIGWKTMRSSVRKFKLENDDVTLTIPEGVYSVPNNKVMAPGMTQPFLEQAIAIHEDTDATEWKVLNCCFITREKRDGFLRTHITLLCPILRN